LKDAGAGIDFVVVRENLEGLFASFGGGCVVGDRVATDTIIITREGTEKVVDYAFRLAARRAGRPADGKRVVTCVDKANVFRSFAFFRKVFDEVADAHPDVEADHAYIDAQALYLVQRPGRCDVLVTENLLGDILSDLAAGLVGGMGMAPSADVGDRHAVFQPAHGTAPDIAGKGIANPAAAILSAAMMLEWLGRRHQQQALTEAADSIERAVGEVLGQGKVVPVDQGGSATTAEIGDAVAAVITRGSC
jgi:3-isopropylmalate dehydrogenase